MQEKHKTVILWIIENERGEILITERIDPKIPAAHKKWDVPGWTHEEGETFEETLLREIREETWLLVDIIEALPEKFSKMWEHEEYIQHTSLHCYVCRMVWGELKPNDPKIGEVKRIYAQEVEYFDMLETTEFFLKRYIEK